jgi:hypothetical protein
MDDSKQEFRHDPGKMEVTASDNNHVSPMKVMDQSFFNLRPKIAHGAFQPRLLQVPWAQIIASKRVVQVGEPFNIKVIGNSPIGLSEVCWSGRGTGIVELDKEHWRSAAGEITHQEIWDSITINQPGVFRFGADSRDIRYGSLIGFQSPHQASGAGYISECIVEVREDISYDAQVDTVKTKYGKNDEWANWMKSSEIRVRYENVWQRCSSIPTTLQLAFHYEGTPIAYNPQWENELQHMNALDKMATMTFPGLSFEFLFGVDPATTDMSIEVGGGGATSHGGGNSAYLYYETIFNHEFGHVLNLSHHYAGDDISASLYMPPEEELCVMARSSTQYCSGCRAAMHLDLGADTTAELSAVIDNIRNRYPY